jgi:Protein of unknown function (DUF998)
MKQQVNTNPLVRISAQITIVATSLFVVLLGLLHLLEPEFDPKWRLISEYELGNYGWLMRIAFYSLAAGCISLFIAIRAQIRGIGGTIGLVLLLVIAVGLTIGGIFTTDPITTPADAHTFGSCRFRGVDHHGIAFAAPRPVIGLRMEVRHDAVSAQHST